MPRTRGAPTGTEPGRRRTSIAGLPQVNAPGAPTRRSTPCVDAAPRAAAPTGTEPGQRRTSIAGLPQVNAPGAPTRRSTPCVDAAPRAAAPTGTEPGRRRTSIAGLPLVNARMSQRVDPRHAWMPRHARPRRPGQRRSAEYTRCSPVPGATSPTHGVGARALGQAASGAGLFNPSQPPMIPRASSTPWRAGPEKVCTLTVSPKEDCSSLRTFCRAMPC